MPFRVKKTQSTFNPKVVFAETLKRSVIPVQKKAAKTVHKQIRKIIRDEKIIRTGKYYKSIKVIKKVTSNDLSFEIASVDVPYAKYLEWGTVKMKAKHVFHRGIIKANAIIKKFRKLKVKK